MSLSVLIGLVFFVACVAALFVLRRRSRRLGTVRCDEPRPMLSAEDEIASAASPNVSWKSRRQIAAALEEWLRVERREDDHWNLAFTNLREAFDREVDHHLDVRLYLFTHSQHATDLYNQFMFEETRWTSAR